MELLRLFEGPLSKVSFPDVDQSTLASLADKVRAAAVSVDEARTALAERERALDEAQAALLARGKRALAYARIYAEADAELTATLDALGSLQSGAKSARPKRVEAALATHANEVEAPVSKRRGRPRKNPVVEAQSAADDAAAAAE